MRYCLSHVVSVGEGAGDAVRLGKGLARGVREMSKGPETGAGVGGCVQGMYVAGNPWAWPALEVRGRPAGALVLWLPSTSLSTLVFSHVSNGVKNISFWQTDECQEEDPVPVGV